MIDRGAVRKRNKKPSKKHRAAFGHTPLLSLEEEIPWDCKRLMVGTGVGALPVMDAFRAEAKRKVDLIVLTTAEAIRQLEQKAEKTNAILHVTC